MRFGSLGLISNQFWSQFGVPKLLRKLSENLFFCYIFRTLYYEVLKLFKCLLGAFLGLLYSSWEPPRREKHGFPIIRSHFLKMMLIGALRLLMSSLGSSLHLLAHAPKWTPKWTPKVV